MSLLAVLIGALFALAIGLTVWRVVTMPMRVARSVRRLNGTLQQRQADKAAGKPVAPINWLAAAGIALAIGGLIVARAANGIIGLGMMVLGVGVILIGTKMFAKSNSAPNGAYPQQQSGWNPGQGGQPPQGYGQGGYGDPRQGYGRQGYSNQG